MSAPPRLLHHPLSAASEPVLLPHSQLSHQEHTLSSGRRSQGTPAAATPASSGHQHPAPILPVGTAAQPRLVYMPAAVMPEVALSSAAEAQPQGAQQGLPQLPQGMDSPQPDSTASASPSMHHLAATVQLLHHIDLETADHHAGFEQLPAALPPRAASQQLSLGHASAANMAAGNESQLLGCLPVTEQADAAEDQNGGSSGSLARADAVQQYEEGQTQEANAGSQPGESLQQEGDADACEKHSQQHPEVQGVSAESTESAQGWEARDSCTDGSHEATSWGMQEEASCEMEGQFLAGQSCRDLGAHCQGLTTVDCFVAATSICLQ